LLAKIGANELGGRGPLGVRAEKVVAKEN